MNKITINTTCKIIGKHFGYSLKKIKDKISSRVADDLESPYVQVELEDKIIKFAVMRNSFTILNLYDLDKFKKTEAYSELKELLMYPNTEFVVFKGVSVKTKAADNHFFCIRFSEGDIKNSFIFKDENEEYLVDSLSQALEKMYPSL